MTDITPNLPCTAPTPSNPVTGSDPAVKKNRKINPRRLELIELSKQARALIDLGSERLMGLEDLTVNNVILHVFYPAGEYHLYKEWKEKGFQVRRDEKGFAIWGRKRKMKRKASDEHQESSEYDGFPVAYLFHVSQVEKIGSEQEKIA